MSPVLLIAVSIVAGCVGAMSGIGGGIVLIPALTLFGIDIKHAIAVSVLSTLVISNTAASWYVKRHMPHLRVSGLLEVYAVFGAGIGSLVTLVSARRLLFVLCGGTFLLCSAILWRRRRRGWQPIIGGGIASRISEEWDSSYYDDAERRTITYRGRRAVLAGSLVGLAAMVSVWVGVGSSALIVFINDTIIGLPPKVALTTTSLVIGVMALTSSGVYLEGGLFDPRLVAPMIVGVTIGALVGSRLTTKLTNRTASAAFLPIITLLGVELLIVGVRGHL